MTQAIPYDLGLSHQGSSDKRHLKEAAWALKVRWEAIKMAGQAPLEFQRAYGNGKLYKIGGKEILPVKYIGKLGDHHQEIALVVEFPAQAGDIKALESWGMQITVRDELGGKSHTYTNADDVIYLKVEKGALVIQFWVDELLKRLGAKVNLNLLSAKVEITANRVDNGNEVSGSAVTATPLHILLQKLIVLLPGVMASSIWVNDIKCYPGLYKVPEKLRLLACSEEGEPMNAAEHICFVTPGNPYETKSWQDLLNKDLPKLKVLVSKGVFGETYADVPYYSIQGYPYDWRLKASVIIEALFGGEAEVPANYVGRTFNGAPEFFVKKGVKPLSIRTIVKYWSKTHPFMHSKVSLMGHSTGAAIMNGIVRDDRAVDLVDKAFFVAAPFFGALKAYNAFLCGTMNLGAAESFVLEKNEMLKLGKNLPVLYFLMPNANFPAPVMEITTENDQKEYYRTDRAGEAMRAVLDFAEEHKITALTLNAVTWNDTLAQGAADFTAACQQTAVKIGAKNCVVYWSTMGPQSTIGTILYDARSSYNGQADKRISYRMTGGDATVPSESLRGSFPASSLCQITEDGHLDHVTIIAAKSLWKRTAETLGEILPTDG